MHYRLGSMTRLQLEKATPTLSLGKAAPISHRRNPSGIIQLLKKKKKKKVFDSHVAELVWYIDSDICCVQVTLLGYTDTQKIYGLTARCWVCYLTNTVFVTVRYHTLFVGLKCGHYVHMYTDSDTESVI